MWVLKNLSRSFGKMASGHREALSTAGETAAGLWLFQILYTIRSSI